MARGDYIKVKMKAVNELGVDVEVIKASSVGATVEVDEGRVSEPFIKVREVNKAGIDIRTARFAKEAILSIVQGHEETKRGKK